MNRLRPRFVVTLATLIAGVLPGVGFGQVHDEVLAAQSRRREVIDRCAESVVAIFGPGGAGGGSGVLISADGYAVTNFHVTEGAGNFMQCGLNDGRVYHAVIVGIDPTGDVAVIRLLGRDDFPAAAIGDSDLVEVGDWAYAMGNPFLLATDFQPTVTYGIVSGVHRYQYPAGTFLEYTDCLQVDTSINPGNSGGPLFNDQGELIGINGRGSFEKRGRVNSGAGYAISVNQVMLFLDHLKSGRIVDHATLGAMVASNAEGAIIVTTILENSDAYRRGLREGDEIVTFAGRPIGSVNQFKNILGIYPRGYTLPLTYRRDGEKHDILVQLRALHRISELVPDEEPMPMPGDEPRPIPEQPDPEQPDPEQPMPGQPFPIPLPGLQEAVIPEEYAHMFVERRGFANYYFNELERDRVMQGIDGWGDFSQLKGLWEIEGTTGGGQPFLLKLGENLAGINVGEEFSVQPLDQPFEDQPAGSGGLLVAMHQFKQLLVDPQGYFSEFYYLGSEPLDGIGPTVDVLITLRGGATCRWYFDRQSQTWLGVDTALTEDAETCRIRVNGTISVDDRQLPQVWNVRYGTEPYTVLTFESVRLDQ
jgi:S1-C subfamily serine protease